MSTMPLAGGSQSDLARTPGTTKFATGTIVRMPHQLGFPRASAIAIHTIIAITMLSKGTRSRRNHHIGFLAMLSMRNRLAIGIQASHAFAVLVLLAMVCKASDI